MWSRLSHIAGALARYHGAAAHFEGLIALQLQIGMHPNG
jgi:hypothetical protein